MTNCDLDTIKRNDISSFLNLNTYKRGRVRKWKCNVMKYVYIILATSFIVKLRSLFFRRSHFRSSWEFSWNRSMFRATLPIERCSLRGGVLAHCPERITARRSSRLCEMTWNMYVFQHHGLGLRDTYMYTLYMHMYRIYDNFGNSKMDYVGSVWHYENKCECNGNWFWFPYVFLFFFFFFSLYRTNKRTANRTVIFLIDVARVRLLLWTQLCTCFRFIFDRIANLWQRR